MHELSLCHAIAGIVERHAAGRPVDVVRVRIGAFRQVVPETLTYCWELLADDPDLAGSVLEVEAVPAVVECRDCGADSTLEVPVPRCGSCGSSAVTLISGEEFLVTSLELAVV